MWRRVEDCAGHPLAAGNTRRQTGAATTRHHACRRHARACSRTQRRSRMYDTFKPAQPWACWTSCGPPRPASRRSPPGTEGQAGGSRGPAGLSTCASTPSSRHGHIPGCHLVPRGIIEAAADPTYVKHYPELSGRARPAGGGLLRHRGRAAMAVAVLQMMGFRNVLNLAGGYARWQAEGMPQVHEAEF